MERVTISVSDELAAELAAFMANNNYQNRSEAVRDLARLSLKRVRLDRSVLGECVATLSYVFNHHKRELVKRLTEAHHDHHELQVSAMHVHLDHASCMEVAVLQGKTRDVQHLADAVIAERGVRHGRVVMVPVEIERQKHPHGGGPTHRHPHVHVRRAG